MGNIFVREPRLVCYWVTGLVQTSSADSDISARSQLMSTIDLGLPLVTL
jgi:hypothetical protein